MLRQFKSVCLTLLWMVVFASLPCVAYADSDGAADLTADMEISFSDSHNRDKITDGDMYTYTAFSEAETITLSCEQDMAGLYILWNKIPGQWSYTADGKHFTGGENGFLHEFIELSTAAKELVIAIPAGGAEITDLYAFSAGTLPDWVQVWDPPCELADILLFSTHADDEQLFFAGILPYYAIERQVSVQVVYMTNHWDTVTRSHEQLNGLWTVGIRNYPVISDFPDDPRSLGKNKEDAENVLARAQSVYNEAHWVRFEVEMIRRFRPQVVVDHDFNGEYGHGAHMLNSEALTMAVELCRAPEYDPQTVAQYGVWDVPKTYFHLYEKNPIALDWDTPYESLGGLTPFEVTQMGFACHDSQQDISLADWLAVEKAADIDTYSPCQYGLYRTTVGPDIAKNDLLEHITPYAVQAAQREEAERRAREAMERRRQLEEEKRRQEEAEQIQQEELIASARAADVRLHTGLLILLLGFGLLCALVLIRRAVKKPSLVD